MKMGQSFGQSLQLKQKQSMVMTPRLQQAIRMLQMTNLDLNSYLEDQALENPFLEVERKGPDGFAETGNGHANAEARADAQGEAAAAAPDESMKTGSTPSDDPTAHNDFENRYESAERDPAALGYKSMTGGAEGDWDMISSSIANRPPSLYEHIAAQIDMQISQPRQKMIAYILLDALQPCGWLGRDIETLAEEQNIALEELRGVLSLCQKFEPAGLFATGLANCLALQAADSNCLTPALQIMLDNLDMLARGRMAQLARKCKCSEADLQDLLAIIRSFNPKPGEAFSSEAEMIAEPDLIVRMGDTGWQVELNHSTLPAVKIDETYARELNAKIARRDDQKFAMQALSSARWLKRAMEQRNSTTLAIAAEIIRQQAAFLEKGLDHLKPLLLRDVAKAVGMHESTVSRVTTGLMITTPRGSFTLKSFFSVSLAGEDDSDEAKSAAAVRHLISKIVSEETPGKPLSDDAIAAMVSDKGIKLARRTVAKYRTMLKIPSSAERRRQAKLARLG